MLQDTDEMVASCVFYIKVGMYNQLEQTKVCVLTVTKIGIVRQIVKHDTICVLTFM